MAGFIERRTRRQPASLPASLPDPEETARTRVEGTIFRTDEKRADGSLREFRLVHPVPAKWVEVLPRGRSANGNGSK